MVLSTLLDIKSLTWLDIDRTFKIKHNLYENVENVFTANEILNSSKVKRAVADEIKSKNEASRKLNDSVNA